MDDIRSELVSKNARIKELNKYIEEIKEDTNQEIRELKDELKMQQKKIEQYKQLEKFTDMYNEKIEECDKIN